LPFPADIRIEATDWLNVFSRGNRHYRLDGRRRVNSLTIGSWSRIGCKIWGGLLALCWRVGFDRLSGIVRGRFLQDDRLTGPGPRYGLPLRGDVGLHPLSGRIRALLHGLHSVFVMPKHFRRAARTARKWATAKIGKRSRGRECRRQGLWQPRDNVRSGIRTRGWNSAALNLSRR
jgi:hypothetical protein